jgi:proline iminopeptidase
MCRVSSRVLLVLLVSIAAACEQRQTTPPVERGSLIGAAGTRIYYELVGSGPDTLIVVHGGPGAGMNDIRPDLGPLAKHHAVVYYDQRGGGRSELPADTGLLAADYFVEDLGAVRRHFHLDPATLVAHSFGAIIVAAYARAHPEHVGRIVLLGATGPSREQAARFYRAQPATSDTVSTRLRSQALRTLLDGTATDPVAACRDYEALGKKIAAADGEFVGWNGSTCDMPAPAVRYYYRYTAQIGAHAFGNWDFTTSLADLQAPLLVIDGERDISGLAMETAWTRAVPNGRLLIVSDAGRAAHAERPELVFPAIETFLSGGWPASARRPE